MRETERSAPRFKGLDLWSDEDLLGVLWEGQMSAIAAVRAALPAIAAAAGAMAVRLHRPGSRLIYAGAGTSGMLAALDGMEMPQTFGWPADRLVVLVAGGDAARLRQMGGAEDDALGGRRDLDALKPGADDVVVAVAASGSTPYTVAVMEAAAARGALAVAIANTPDSPLLRAAHHPILVESGAEAVAGSTRMNAGTAQKAVLGMLSTLTMTRLHHVVDGLMVSLVADNDKLTDRAVRIVAELAEVEEDDARTALARTDGTVKSAVLVALGATPDQAGALLARHDGDLRAAMTESAPPAPAPRAVASD